MDHKRGSRGSSNFRANLATALFIITLVLTLPFTSALTMQLTQNSGEEGLNQWLDAASDTWTVETLIQGAVEEVGTNNVQIKIGQNAVPFTNCESSAAGVRCQYVSPLSSGVPEGSYQFDVQFLGQERMVERRDIIQADGSAPQVVDVRAEQLPGQKVDVRFTVTDDISDKPSVGLKRVEIIDADSKNVLQVIDTFERNQKEYQHTGVLENAFQGEGLKRITVVAEDLLGHRTVNPPIVAFRSDFVLPAIKTESINFSQLGRFLGQFIATSDITIDVTDTNLAKVEARSDDMVFPNTEAACVPDENDVTLHHCRWQDVQIEPKDVVTLTVIATDSYGNEADATVSKSSWVRDAIAPRVEYFNSEHTFLEQGFVKDGTNRILLKVNEEGAGMRLEDVRADLRSIGGEEYQQPTNCIQNEVFTCYWDVHQGHFATDIVRIGLSKLHDIVGNEADLSQVDLLVDNSGPYVTELNIVALEGERNYFQSNDNVKIDFVAKEGSGLKILVDLGEIVPDAETKFPETAVTRGLGDGWQVFTQESCTRGQGNWTCSLVTDSIKSGYDSSAALRIIIKDTAGNEVQNTGVWLDEKPKAMKSGASGQYTFEILGLKNEENPNYWEIPPNGVRPLAPFIDIDTVPLINTRMAFDISLRTDGDARVKKVELLGCESDLETPGRQVIWGNTFAEAQASPAKFKLLLEFPPFDVKKKLGVTNSSTFTTGYIDHLCRVRIFSQVGVEAIKNGEIQEFNVKVPFGFTLLGAADENLKERIDKLKKEVDTGFFGTIGEIEDALRWVKRVLGLVDLLVKIIETWDLADKVFGSSAGPAENYPFVGEATTMAMIGYCFGGNLGKGAIGEVVQGLQIPMQILTCQQVTCDGEKCKSGSYLGVPEFYNTWALFFVNKYNSLAQSGLSKIPETTWGDVGKFSLNSVIPDVKSPYENLYLSTVSLCLPGIIHNLDKLRQIDCRYISCLENDVPAGKATVAACSELKDVMECKYFYGPLFQIFPVIQVWDGIVKGFQSLLVDPVAWIPAAAIGVCAAQCLTPVKGVRVQLSSACIDIHFVIKFIGLIESLFQGYQDWANAFEGSPDYCSQVL